MLKRLIIIFTIILIAAAGIILLNNYRHDLSTSKIEGDAKSSRLTTNFPYSIRRFLSYAIRRSAVLDIYGEPDKTQKSDDYSFDIWLNKDESKLVAVYNCSILTHLYKYKAPLSQKDFENIIVHTTTYEDILDQDPYTYLYVNEEKAFSEHILLDNVVLHIDYKKDGERWIVDQYELQEDALPFPDIYSIGEK